MLLKGLKPVTMASTARMASIRAPVALCPVAPARAAREFQAFQPAHASARGMRASPVSTSAVAVKMGKAPPRDQVITTDPANNVSDYIYEKMGVNLHQQRDHPIAIIKQVQWHHTFAWARVWACTRALVLTCPQGEGIHNASACMQPMLLCGACTSMALYVRTHYPGDH